LRKEEEEERKYDKEEVKVLLLLPIPLSILTLSSHLRLGLPSGLFPSEFLIKIFYTLNASMRAIYEASHYAVSSHLPPLSHPYVQVRFHHFYKRLAGPSGRAV
jgi:hypothetical protein